MVEGEYGLSPSTVNFVVHYAERKFMMLDMQVLNRESALEQGAVQHIERGFESG